MITRYLYPYRLREKISHRLQRWLRLPWPENEIELAFAPGMVMRLQQSDLGHQSIMLNGFYELSLTRRIIALAKTGGMLVDAGANYGYYSILWLAQNSCNRCVAFEASPDNARPLQENIDRNRLSDRFLLEPRALSDHSGRVSFSKENAGGQTGWGGIAQEPSTETIEVEATTLDEYWAAHFPESEIEVLKIDVEGADTLVLEGATGLLRNQRIRHIFYEVNQVRMAKLSIGEGRAESLLNAHGYRVEQIAANEFHACP